MKWLVVDVGAEGNDARNGSALGGAATSEDREIGIVGEVGRTAYAVHHLGATDLGAVHMAIDVGFDCRVERTYTDAGNHLGAVGNLRRAQHEFVFKEIHV